jgi:hypothetical protein
MVSVTGRSVSLSWEPPAAGALPVDYLVEAGTQPDAVMRVATTATPRLTVADAPPGHYVVRVRARNAAGLSAPSTLVAVVVP